MRQPEVYTANTIRLWDASVEVPHKYWIPARPEGHNLYSLWHRVKTAWLVFTGRYDAVDWSRP